MSALRGRIVSCFPAEVTVADVDGDGRTQTGGPCVYRGMLSIHRDVGVLCNSEMKK